MEEEMVSVVEDLQTSEIVDNFEWSSARPTIHERRRQRNNFPLKFKGVVPQPNGHWGAQIYASHQRIWLGTFQSEIDAAMAYDSASIKLRIGDNYRNFPWTKVTVHEPKFQSLHSTEEILNMIRDGSYPLKFEDFLRSQKGKNELGVNLIKVQGHGSISCKLLFQKELTPSDVGKLNRLVIPKKYATKFFPPMSEDNEEGGKIDEMHLFFYDRMMRLWKFRYCYWKSSQSFVFTRGWNRFVKEKGLKTSDIIAFYICEGQEHAKEDQSFYVIDIGHTGGSRNCMEEERISQNIDMQVDLSLKLGQNDTLGLVKEEEEYFKHHHKFSGFGLAPKRKSTVTLFGVELN